MSGNHLHLASQRRKQSTWFADGARVGSKEAGLPPQDGDSVRRWEAGKTTRLNSAHWGLVNGNYINDDLGMYLDTLRARCFWEMANNPTVEGIIDTYASDFVGVNGPKLQVVSEDEQYNDLLEGFWREWVNDPKQFDLAGTMTLADMMLLWVRTWFTDGEYLVQLVNEGRPKVMNIAPRRLKSPMGSLPSKGIVMGVARNKHGRPTAYYIEKADPGLAGSSTLGATSTVKAANMIHMFFPTEAGQARGIPWLASNLQIIADMRDYDEQVLDAARSAADMAVYFYTKREDITFQEVNESTEIERRQQSFLPPGYEMAQLDPKQPATVYADYRGARHGDMGRPFGMPRMMVDLDASGYNYSSARMENQKYWVTIGTKRGACARTTLNPLVEREAAFRRMTGKLGMAPAGVRYVWVWDSAPHVDPKKEAEAEAIQLANFTRTLSDAVKDRGTDIESHIAQLKKEKELMDAAGLAKATVVTMKDSDDEKDEEDVPKTE